MTESAADLLQALQQKAATGLQSIKQAVHEYEFWLADATAQARERLRSIPSAKVGDSSAPPALHDKDIDEHHRPAPAGKRRKKASPALATVAEEEAEQGQEVEGLEQTEPQAADEQPAEQKPARRQPGRKAKAKSAAETAPAATTKRRTRAQAKAAAWEGSEAPSEAASDAAAAEEDRRQNGAAPTAELAEQSDHFSADDLQCQQMPGRAEEGQAPAQASQHESVMSRQAGSMPGPTLQAAASQVNKSNPSVAEERQATATQLSEQTPARPDLETSNSAETGTGDGAAPAMGSAAVLSEQAPAEGAAGPERGLLAHEPGHTPDAATRPQQLLQYEPAVQQELELVLDTDALEGHAASPQPERVSVPREQPRLSAASPGPPLQHEQGATPMASNADELPAAHRDSMCNHPTQDEPPISELPMQGAKTMDVQLSSPDKAASPHAVQQLEDASQPGSPIPADEPNEAPPGSPADDAADAASPEPEQVASAAPAEAASYSSKAGGLNLVSAIRSFLPGPVKASDNAPPKKAVKVKALEAADAARQRERERAAERGRQKQALEQQKLDRARQVHEAKARQEKEQQRKAEQAKVAMQKREEEAAAARKAREEAEKRERREKQLRQEEARLQKRQQEQRAEAQAANEKRSQAEEERKRKAQAAIARELEAKRARPAPNAVTQLGQVQPPAQTGRAPAMPPPAALPAARPAFPIGGAPAAQAGRPVGGSALPPSRLQQASYATDPPPTLPASATPAQGKHVAAQPKSTQRKTPAVQRVAEDPSYEISPYRGDSEDSEEEEEEEEPQQKRVPAWARGQELMRHLHAQLATDPDEIFQQRQRTCALDDVFSAPVRPQPGKRDLKERRTSTSNWIEDRVTWQEEKLYKKAMGYMK